MSTSHPSPILMRKVSPLSFRSLPRSGTLMSPKATCRITGSPIHGANALSMPPPRLDLQPDERENRREHCGRQWYSEGSGVGERYCRELASREGLIW